MGVWTHGDTVVLYGTVMRYDGMRKCFVYWREGREYTASLSDVEAKLEELTDWTPTPPRRDKKTEGAGGPAAR